MVFFDVITTFFAARNYTRHGDVFLIFWILAVNSFLVLAFILVATIHRERDFVYFCSLSKNSNIGVTSEVNPVKFRGLGGRFSCSLQRNVGWAWGWGPKMGPFHSFLY